MDVDAILSLVQHHQNSLSEAIQQVEDTEEGELEKQNITLKKIGISAAFRQFAKRLRDSQLLLENTLDDYEEYKHLRNSKTKKLKKDATANMGPPDTEDRERREIQVGEASEPQNQPDIDDEREGRGGRGERGEEGEGRSTVDVKELISYAHKISYTTFAPPEFAQGLGLGLMGALPPAPQDEHMRASALYQFTEDDLGLPKDGGSETPMASIKKEAQTVPPLTQEAGEPLPPSPLSSVPPGGVKKEVSNGGPLPLPPPPPPPPGWKPGDPISLPPDSLSLPPPPPPGWKPGDPIPLPPFPMAPPPSLAVRPALPARAGPPPPPTFQVRHVELDLNPELEDSESDYSGSSDED